MRAKLLVNIPPGTLTVTKPEVAPDGTVAVIRVLDLTANEAVGEHPPKQTSITI